MNNQSNQSNNSYSLNGQYSISELQRNVTIPVLVSLLVPSLLCFLFIFYKMFKFRQRLIINCIDHHATLLILLSDFLLMASELPISLSYLGLGRAPTQRICLFWIYWDYILEMVSLFLTMYVSIERYLLIFFRHTIIQHRVALHYIAMACVGLYIPILYFYLIFFAPCVQHQLFDLSAFVCGGGCFFSYVSLNTYDSIVDTMLPCFILLFFNLLIIIRVTVIRSKALKSASLMKILKKNRRMILQLIGLSLMTLTAWMPWVVIIIAQDFYDPSFGNWFITYFLHYLPYVTASVSPFLALIGLPEIRKQSPMTKYQTKITSKLTSGSSIRTPIPTIAKTHL